MSKHTLIILANDEQDFTRCLRNIEEHHDMEQFSIHAVMKERPAERVPDVTYVQHMGALPSKVNAGVRSVVAEGGAETVTLMKSSVVGHSTWLHHLYADGVSLGKPAMLGVVSRQYDGVQRLIEDMGTMNGSTIASVLRLETVDEAGSHLYPVTTLSGGVLHMSNGAFQELVTVNAKDAVGAQLILNTFNGEGFENDAICSNAVLRGVPMYADLGIFVDEEIPEFTPMYSDWLELLWNYKSHMKPQTVCLRHVVRLRTEQDVSQTLASLRSCKQKFDSAVVLLDMTGYPEDAARKAKDVLSMGYDSVFDDWIMEEISKPEDILQGGLQDDWSFLLYNDEVLPPEVDRELMLRLAGVPDPTVTGYTAKLMVLWDAPTMYRTDGKWKNISQIRMWRNSCDHWLTPSYDVLCMTPARSNCRSTTIDAAIYIQSLKAYSQPSRVAAVSEVKSEYWKEYLRSEMLTFRNLSKETRLGLTMLCYSKEPIEGYAQWFRHMHGLCHAINIVWTESDSVYTRHPISDLADIYGASVVVKSLDDDIAGTRNVGIQALRDAGCHWGCFFDPDEVVPNDAPHIVAMRECTLNTMCWGFLFSFMNKMNGKEGSVVTQSDSIRMFRLRGGRMNMNGRVHEGFDHALMNMQAHGLDPYIDKFPYVLFHTGLAKDEAAIHGKLLKYRDLLLRDIADDPTRCNSWVSLALQFYNDGNYDKATQCFEQSVRVANGAFLPYKEYGLRKLKSAIELLTEARQRMSMTDPSIVAMMDDLFKVAEPLIRDPLIRSEPLPDVELPEGVENNGVVRI